ncbi:MAG: HU family DNA-binding protein [Heliobacteriaceae bacterium]|nr:HU family DNA-binding protein [Heliobacteriaceae bacterium]MDD4586833.1 HU family DNA-binding protein [Heliobacteriaceae bacterium]
MLETLRKTFLVGLGALTLTKEKAEQLVDELAKKGEVSKEDAGKMVDEFLEKGREQREAIADAAHVEFTRFRGEFGVVTRKEYEALAARIAAIEEILGIDQPLVVEEDRGLTKSS